jgi:iron complex outermembrane receptor protein
VPEIAAPKLQRMKKLMGQEWIAATALMLALPSGSLRAQHATDNPVASAEDGFGLTLGLETIGLYGPNGVRGFSPQVAGNVRIDGLYFDQQGALSNRVVEGSTIRIGVTEIGYAFPAPTGIVDYDLRHAGDGKPSASLVASAGPFDNRGLSADANVPLIGTELQLPIGASYQVSAQTPVGPYPGYTANVANVGAAPQWKPNDALTFRAIADWTQLTQVRTMPVVFTAGDFLPPDIGRQYLGQDWALGRSIAENYGGLVNATLSPRWSLSAGLFRSIADNPQSYTDLYLNTAPDGLATHALVGYPDQSVASTSGEMRLTGHFPSGSLSQDLVLLARGRDTWAYYGGADVIGVGTAPIGQGAQVPEPDFSYTARTEDHTELRSTGLAYRAQWRERADLALGIQRESYDKEVTAPGGTLARLVDNPLRGYGSLAAVLTTRITAYAGYTQGLEDSGVAPNAAENRGAILPATRTWQADSGLRYMFTPNVKLIAGLFEINKPYFNLDTSNVERELGMQRARGVELSLSGELVSHLHIAAGALLGQVTINGPNLQAEGVGRYAFGQARDQGVITADYSFPQWPAASADLTIFHAGATPSSIDDAVQAPAVTSLTLGARYRFTVRGAPATLRVQLSNLTNAYVWVTGYSPGYYPFPPRNLLAYLTIDV